MKEHLKEQEREHMEGTGKSISRTTKRRLRADGVCGRLSQSLGYRGNLDADGKGNERSKAKQWRFASIVQQQFNPVGSRMNKHRIHSFALCVLTSAGLLISGSAWSASLSEVHRVAERINTQAKRSQAKIDALTDETRQLTAEYKTVLKEIEGLRVYNRQLEKQISNQEKEMNSLTKAIDDVTVIERQITPLMLRMIDGLEQFVKLDMPFLLDERTERVNRLREIMDRADVAVSEKFSQVLNAFQIENEYGRTMEAYSGSVTVDGTERLVDILKVGRIALVYQTPDGAETGMWNKESNQWERLDDSYKSTVNNGIRMARKQLSQNMLNLPVPGPEGAQ